jgi:hypothetical protein
MNCFSPNTWLALEPLFVYKQVFQFKHGHWNGYWVLNRAVCARTWHRTSCMELEATKCRTIYKGVPKSSRTGRLERELQTVQLSATSCSCIAIFWVSLVSFAAITLCVAFQRETTKLKLNIVIDPVRKPLDTPSYILQCQKLQEYLGTRSCHALWVTVVRMCYISLR